MYQSPRTTYDDLSAGLTLPALPTNSLYQLLLGIPHHAPNFCSNKTLTSCGLPRP